MTILNHFDTAIQHEQIRSLYRQSPLVFIGIVTVMIIVSMFFWGKVEQHIIVTWLIFNITLTTGRAVLVKSFHHVKPEGSSLVVWGMVFAASSTLSGIIWGSLSWFFLHPADVEGVLLVAIVLTGMCAGSLVPLSTFMPAYFGFCLPALTPLAVIMLTQTALVFMLIGYMVIAFIMINLGYSFVVNRNLAESIQLRLENLELMQDLQLQKEIAEKANTEKSRFLAATSHDLRQPLHALDLYLGALDNLLNDREQKALLDKSRLSSEALSSLLGALMDISKLDVGDVVIKRKIVNTSEILTSIYNEFLEQAKLAGIDLQIHSPLLYLESDPILLVRILRNLVSNAIRHSNAKTISIRAKKINQQVYIEVKDNGCGIPESEHGKIFSEFYQLTNPERDRNKGLGLGLAIVKRLADILGHELILSSSLGKGCCFRLLLPLVEVGLMDDSTEITEPEADISGMFILLIEDEGNVREAMRSLLKQWGCELLAAESLESMVHELQQNCYETPDVIVADYRLRENQTGIDAILRLRNQFDRNIPAIIISGDTHLHIIGQAKEKNCNLLHKPVRPEKLRRTIFNCIS